MAGLLPGEVLDLNRLEIFKKRLGSTGYFNGNAGNPSKPIDVKVVNRRPGTSPTARGRSPTSAATCRIRGCRAPAPRSPGCRRPTPPRSSST